MAIFWALLMIALVILEVSTINLVSVWFAVGSLAAMIAAMLGAKFYLQLLLFLIVSVAVLLLLRPAIKKLMRTEVKATNADRVIGMSGFVTEEIDNSRSSGTVNIDGKEWTARSADGAVITVGETVVPKKIEGVKLIVARTKSDEFSDIH